MAVPTYVYTTPPLTASGGTWAQLRAGGLSGQVERLAAKTENGLKAAPTGAPTVADTASSGGTVAAGDYIFKFTYTDGFGETTPSPASTAFAVVATHTQTITFGDSLPTGCARNLYVTPVGGAAGTERLLKAGITAATYLFDAPAGTEQAPAPPATNTTGVVGSSLARVRSVETGNLQREYLAAVNVVDSYVSGSPVGLREVLASLGQASGAFKVLSVAIDEVAVLVAANPGTLAMNINTPSRTWS